MWNSGSSRKIVYGHVSIISSSNQKNIWESGDNASRKTRDDRRRPIAICNLEHSGVQTILLYITWAMSVSISFPIVVKRVQRHSKLSSSSHLRNLTKQPCMMFSDNILRLKSSPRNLNVNNIILQYPTNKRPICLYGPLSIDSGDLKSHIVDKIHE